ncbi:MAG TPA: hypothetical protein VFR15_20900 [Chloroflexia bacterium]|nr:hypothetical protein [Chloroflexia bacterium]
MFFEFIGELSEVETIASGRGIKEIASLRKVFGRGNWRKRKGMATIRLADETVHTAELHWYEATGLGKKEFKIKRILD